MTLNINSSNQTINYDYKSNVAGVTLFSAKPYNVRFNMTGDSKYNAGSPKVQREEPVMGQNAVLSPKKIAF